MILFIFISQNQGNILYFGLVIEMKLPYYESK